MTMPRISLSLMLLLFCSPIARAESPTPPDFKIQLDGPKDAGPPPDIMLDGPKDAGPPPDIMPYKEGGFICDVYWVEGYQQPDLPQPDLPQPDLTQPDLTQPDGGVIGSDDFPIEAGVYKDGQSLGDGGAFRGEDDDGGCTVAAGPSKAWPLALALILGVLRRRKA